MAAYKSQTSFCNVILVICFKYLRIIFYHDDILSKPFINLLMFLYFMFRIFNIWLF